MSNREFEERYNEHNVNYCGDTETKVSQPIPSNDGFLVILFPALTVAWLLLGWYCS